MTNKELYWVVSMPEFLKKTTFYRGAFGGADDPIQWIEVPTSEVKKALGLR